MGLEVVTAAAWSLQGDENLPELAVGKEVSAVSACRQVWGEVERYGDTTAWPSGCLDLIVREQIL